MMAKFQVFKIILTISTMLLAALTVSQGASGDACKAIPMNLTATEEVANITSNGYPNFLVANSSCKWQIIANPGYIIRLDVAVGSIGDYWQQKIFLRISDSVHRLHDLTYLLSYTNATYFTLSNMAEIIFVTNNDVDIIGYPKGFVINYREVSMNDSSAIAIIRGTTPGTLQSNHYPEYYSSADHQAWFIDCGHRNEVINMTLSVSSMGGTVTIYDGNTTTADDILVQSSFSNYESSFVSSTDKVFIVFASNGYSFGYPQGFLLHYKPETKDPAKQTVCQEIRKVPQKICAFGVITNDYFNYETALTSAQQNSNCGWLLESAAGTKIGFSFPYLLLGGDSQPCWGNVTIYDGESTMSPVVINTCTGGLNPKFDKFYSSSNSALVVFQSADTKSPVVDPAFALNYWEELSSGNPCPDVVNINSQSATFGSSGYPNRYDRYNGNCTWLITGAPGSFTKLTFSVGSLLPDDYVYFDCAFAATAKRPRISVLSEDYTYNITLCNSYHEVTLIVPSSSTIVRFYPENPSFHYEDLVNFAQFFRYPSGFTVTYEQVLPDKATPCQEMRRLSVSGQNVHGMITSDNFPQSYDGGSDCQWLVTAPEGYIIKFTFQQIDLRDSNCEDSLIIYDGHSTASKILEQFCGNDCKTINQVGYYSASNTSLIRFKTSAAQRYNTGYSGFNIFYEAVLPFSNSACRGLTTIDMTKEGSNMTGLIQNNGYPDSYEPFSYCRWRIIAPPGYVLFFNVTTGHFDAPYFKPDSTLAITKGFVPSCGLDLYRYDSSQQTANNNRTGLESTANVAVVYFETYYQISQIPPGELVGFQIEYRAELAPPVKDNWWKLWVLLAIIAGCVIVLPTVLYIIYRYAWKPWNKRRRREKYQLMAN